MYIMYRWKETMDVFPYLFECTKSVLCYELTSRCSPFPLILASSLTYVVYSWYMHCKCALMQKQQQILTIFTFVTRKTSWIHFIALIGGIIPLTFRLHLHLSSFTSGSTHSELPSHKYSYKTMLIHFRPPSQALNLVFSASTEKQLTL